MPERVGDRRLPEGARVLFTGCGTSFHAALACGPAAQALEVVLGNAPEADVLVAISHEGGTALTLEAVRGFEGETWLITGAAESAIAKAADNVVVATPAIEESYCHTVSYTCAVAAGRALRGEDVSGLAADVFRELDAEPIGASEHDRYVVAGAGSDAATVARGGSQAPRGRARRGGGAPDGAAPPRAPRGHRLVGPLLRAGGRGTRCRAGRRRDAGARRARL